MEINKIASNLVKTANEVKESSPNDFLLPAAAGAGGGAGLGALIASIRAAQRNRKFPDEQESVSDQALIGGAIGALLGGGAGLVFKGVTGDKALVSVNGRDFRVPLEKLPEFANIAKGGANIPYVDAASRVLGSPYTYANRIVNEALPETDLADLSNSLLSNPSISTPLGAASIGALAPAVMAAPGAIYRAKANNLNPSSKARGLEQAVRNLAENYETSKATANNLSALKNRLIDQKRIENYIPDISNYLDDTKTAIPVELRKRYKANIKAIENGFTLAVGSKLNDLSLKEKLKYVQQLSNQSTGLASKFQIADRQKQLRRIVQRTNFQPKARNFANKTIGRLPGGKAVLTGATAAADFANMPGLTRQYLKNDTLRRMTDSQFKSLVSALQSRELVKNKGLQKSLLNAVDSPSFINNIQRLIKGKDFDADKLLSKIDTARRSGRLSRNIRRGGKLGLLGGALIGGSAAANNVISAITAEKN